MVTIIGLAVALSIVLPVYVVREINTETQSILDRIELQVKEDQETAIKVNVATIACLSSLEEVAPTEFRFRLQACIDEALTIVEE